MEMCDSCQKLEDVLSRLRARSNHIDKLGDEVYRYPEIISEQERDILVCESLVQERERRGDLIFDGTKYYVCRNCDYVFEAD